MQKTIESTQLNKMSMKEARNAIVQNLINRWSSIDESLESLSKSLVEFENKLKAAREDGDTSENSAYEQAINNVSMTQANIHKTQKVKYDMSLIAEPEFVAATHMDDYIDVIDTLTNMREVSAMSELAFRHFENDISRIATCSRAEMKKLMFKVNYIISNGGDSFDYNESEQEVVELLKEITTKYKTRPYKSCGKVVLYSVVRVEVNDTMHTFMICPDDVSYVREGIIASNSELASKLLNGEVGDSNIIREGLRYTIKEIY
jgi:transcription elongation GreA/GreB family factor